MLPIDPGKVTDIYSLLALVVLCISTLATLVISLKGNKIAAEASKNAAVAKDKSIENGNKIQEVHGVINSRLTELVEATRAASEAKGIALGQATERARADAATAAQAQPLARPADVTSSLPGAPTPDKKRE